MAPSTALCPHADGLDKMLLANSRAPVSRGSE